jgi:acyl-[acyl-carrier-protein]-phospholipid O-acyltransferase/long-chain-fatty-acid--[acyl-carrier-protein] ligase
VFTWDFASVVAGAQGLASVAAFIAAPQGWRVLADLLLLAACGGAYSVPLYALVQARAAPERRARVIGANNVVNAACMVIGAVVAGGLAAIGLVPSHILEVAAVANLGAVWAAWRFSPAVQALPTRQTPPEGRRAGTGG